MSKVLITGTNSFIGNNFIRYSENKDVRVISLRDILPDDIDFADVEVVLHLAAIVHVFNKIDEKDYYRINRDMTLDLARFAKGAGVRQFIFLSSVKVFGEFISGSQPWNEDSPCNPCDHYGISKYEAEQGLNRLHDNDFAISIIRTPIVYGNGVKANMLKLIKLVETFPVLPFAKIENKRNYTYVENLIGFIDRIIELRLSGTFIAMDNNSNSTTDLVNYLSKYLGKKVMLLKLPKVIIRLGILLLPGLFDRLYRSVELDNTNTKKMLDFIPRYSTEEGIKKMIDAYKNSR